MNDWGRRERVIVATDFMYSACLFDVLSSVDDYYFFFYFDHLIHVEE